MFLMKSVFMTKMEGGDGALALESDNREGGGSGTDPRARHECQGLAHVLGES